MKKIFLLVSVSVVVAIASHSIVPSVKAQQTRAQCGQGCLGIGCEGNMQCLRVAGTTDYRCVNPLGPQCTGANPCCEVSGGGGSSIPSNTTPAGGTTSPNVPSTGTITKPGAPTDNTKVPSGGNTPLSPECKAACDLDNDGIITKSDIQKITGGISNPDTQKKALYCTQQCPFNGQPIVMPTAVISQPPLPGGPVTGDCSGATLGVPDGVVDLKDVEQFRSELTGDVTTKACDFDKNGTVDILDFSDLREGFIK